MHNTICETKKFATPTSNMCSLKGESEDLINGHIIRGSGSFSFEPKSDDSRTSVKCSQPVKLGLTKTVDCSLIANDSATFDIHLVIDPFESVMPISM